MYNEKAFILDYEIVSPIGVGYEQLIPSIRSNFSADKILSRIPTKGIPFRKGAEINQDLSTYYNDESDLVKQICNYDRKLELLAAAYGIGKERIANLANKFIPNRTGVIMGIGADAMQFERFEKEIVHYFDINENPIAEIIAEYNDNGSALNFINNPYDVYSAYLADKFDARKFQKNILTACVSSTQAIAFAIDEIRSDNADIVIAGGADSLGNLVAMFSFGKLGVIAESNDGPSCKPFDLMRNGTLAGECAGFVIIASEKFVKEHDLKPKAELLGYGNTLDGFKITSPDPGGDSMSKAIADAVKDANITPEDIDYINAHGTGTKVNDHLELKCIQRALGDQALKIPISSTKDRHGHAIAAAGIQELILLVELMKHDLIPGNLNMEKICEPTMNLPKVNQNASINCALTNNFAFGGINTVLAVKNLK